MSWQKYVQVLTKLIAWLASMALAGIGIWIAGQWVTLGDFLANPDAYLVALLGFTKAIHDKIVELLDEKSTGVSAASPSAVGTNWCKVW